MAGVEVVKVKQIDDGMRLNRWFLKYYPLLTMGRLQKLLRTKQIKVDGKKAETVPAAGIFLAVPVPEGEHVVEMVYVPRGLYLGITISAFTTICIIAVLQIKRKKQI